MLDKLEIHCDENMLEKLSQVENCKAIKFDCDKNIVTLEINFGELNLKELNEYLDIRAKVRKGEDAFVFINNFVEFSKKVKGRKNDTN